MDVML